ncbi:DUF4795 domain-containing protein [Ruminococcus sp. HUN007]|uniref:DUF4795 domain-containing protein n=1 Tax=Ruminococcus sp. HUN007 TaxID=1514668 RepID=UPI0005D273D4|nr:DUF4795 domain-containing protein [Ruminococcus sp. HUN007]
MNGSYNEIDAKYYYIDFLKYGDVILDDNFLPDFKGHTIIVNDFMPTDCIIRHSKRPDRTFEERIDEIFYRSDSSTDDNMADDYGCAQLIKIYFADHEKEWDEENNNIEANTAEAIKQFRSDFENFKGSLELSQSYGQIDTDRKEQILAMVTIQYVKNENTHNFGYFARLISHIESAIKLEAKIREKSLRINLDTVAANIDKTDKAEEFINEARKMLEKQNYTVAEDLFQRIQNNDFDNKDDLLDEDNLQSFIDEYSENYKLVNDKSRNLKKIIQNSRSPMKDIKRGIELIDNFPTGNHRNPDRMKNLISTLGFPVNSVSVDETNQTTYNSYSIELIRSTNGKKENYTHPISPFGSLAEENGFRVVCLFGMYDARRLIDKFKEIGTTRHTLVILDFALHDSERRTLARKIKEEFFDKIFIVIDRVVIFYLAKHYTENTINRVLMEITMPYSSFQPYSVDSARPIPVEMFMGRKAQLEDIESPVGANIISGGRQLGKSALLRMAKSDINNNENGDRAVYVEIKDCSCAKAAAKISAALVDEGILPEGSETSDWSLLSRSIKKRLNSQTEVKIPYLLLLIDETDTFIEDCKNYNYSPLDDLEDIQSIGVNRFKFVIAGLRNLVKFEKEKSMANNSVIAHLRQYTIKPFTYTEACELLEKPLHYLGIRFPKDQSYLVSLILANTNYFPGLIHFYCAKLIEAVKKYDTVFDETTSPPYEVTEDHIKKVLADSEFRKQIKDKFEITLKLDTDNFYHIIVVLMAYCNYTSDSTDGCYAEDIYKTAEDYDVHKIKNIDIDKLMALMDELCELNILRKNPNGKYLFARYNFLQLLGTLKEIENMIMDYSCEEA